MDEVTRLLKESNLTHRDKDILVYLLENKFADAESIRIQFWDSSVSKLHYRRLRLLQKRGLIEVFTKDGSNCSLFRLSSKGKRILAILGINTQPYGRVRAIYRSPFEHETAVRHVRDTLQKSSLVSNFIPERKVRAILGGKYGKQSPSQERYKVPDGMFSLQAQGKIFRVALEVEMTLKSKKRYRNSFECLLTSPDFDLIFFVVKDKPTREKLMSHVTEAKARSLALKFAKRINGCYFALLSDVLSKSLLAAFTGENSSFSLNGLEQYQS